MARLVVRLVGDSSGYQKMLAEAMQATKQFAASAVGALGVFTAGRYLHEIVGAFAGFENEQIKLNAAIEVSGRSVDELSGRYSKLAEEMSATMLITREQVMQLLRQAEASGISGDAAEQLTRNAIGLSKATDMSAQHALMLVMGLQRGNVEYLRRVPILRGIRDQNELLAKAQQLMAAGMKIAEAESNSLRGQLFHLRQEYVYLLRQFGETVGEFVRPVTAGISDLLRSWQTLTAEQRTMIVTVLGLVAGFAMLPRILMTIGMLLGTVFGPAGALLAAIILPISIAIAQWINSVGGVANAWGIVQEKFRALIAWMMPILIASRAVIDAVWEAIVSGVIYVQNRVTEAWNAIVEESGIDWAEVRDVIVGALGIAAAVISHLDEVVAPLVEGASQLVQIFGVAGLVIAGVIAVGTILALTISSIIGLIHFLGISQAINIAGWAAWTVVVVVAQAVAWTYNAALAALAVTWAVLVTGAAVVAKVAILAWTAAVAVAQGAIWLYNVGVGALALLLGTSATAEQIAAASALLFGGAALVAKIVTWAWNAALTVMNILLGGIPVLVGIVVVAIAALITVLAIAVGAILILPVVLGAVALGALLVGTTIGILTAAFAVLSTAITVGAVVALTSLVAIGAGVSEMVSGIANGLDDLSGAAGPIRAVTDMLGEWLTILKSIGEAVRKGNVNLAWELLAAGAVLAIEQIKALWPPLVTYIGDVLGAGWGVVSAATVLAWTRTMIAIHDTVSIAWERIKNEAVYQWDNIGGTIALAIVRAFRTAFGALGRFLPERIRNWFGLDEATQVIDQAAAAVAASTAGAAQQVGESNTEMLNRLEADLRAAQASLRSALASWGGVTETAGIKAARDRVHAIMTQIAALPDPTKAIEDAMKKGKQVGSGFVQGVKKEMRKLDAVLYDSAEAFTRIAEFLDSQAEGAKMAQAMGIGQARIEGAGTVPTLPPTGAGGISPTPSNSGTGGTSGAGNRDLLQVIVERLGDTNSFLSDIALSVRSNAEEAAL